LFGALLVPAHSAQAGFLSSIFGAGDQVYAEAENTENTPALPPTSTNSQNISLLQANVSSASVLEKKDDKKGGDKKPKK
jgi:hypothetical protein